MAARSHDDHVETAANLTLPLEIHAATRQYHTSLNRLITSRLHLCLPPSAPTPDFYTFGIATFGQIYIAFEEAWEEQLCRSNSEDRIYSILSQTRLIELSRSRRLRNDLDRLDQAFKRIPTSPDSGYESYNRWRSQIFSSICNKPHVTLAYGWVMYMALFNGGRWMRSQLISASGSGTSFWQQSSLDPCDKEGIPGCLSFWQFSGDHDGEDLKVAFKERFLSASVDLTQEERQDIVQEAIRIFQLCLEMVEWLDGRVAAGSAATETVSREKDAVTVSSTPITTPPSSWLPLQCVAPTTAVLSSVWLKLSSATSVVTWRKTATPFLLHFLGASKPADGGKGKCH